MMRLQEDDLRLERPVHEVWQQAQDLLAKRGIKHGTLHGFISQLRLKEVTGQDAVLAAANKFGKDFITGRHFEDIQSAISQALGRDVKLRIVVDESVADRADDYKPSIFSIVSVNEAPAVPPQAVPPASAFDEAMRAQAANLNPKHTLATFIVGSHNRFCHSAAVAVAERPGQTYNPLFIYGGVGLGKTHIMQAIGHHVAQTHPRMVVRYITCERFTNDLINSLRENRMIDFRKRYRQVDLLLVDDVQFIAGKESTQEEFFHTFNTLRESGRQIVLSSDRPPKDMAKLEERLRSRFEWGLIADMQPPDFETRLAILRSKCESERLSVADEVLEYIATMFTNNIRELEGALVRAHAYTNLNGQPLNLSTASRVLQIGTPVSNKPNLTVENIIGAVAAHYRVDTSDLRSQKRSKDLALPRHVAMFLAHDLLSMSHSRIGESFGNRKHSSVIYAIDKIKEELAADVQLSHAVQQIRRQLGV